MTSVDACCGGWWLHLETRRQAFTLAKEGKDTMEGIALLAKLLQRKPKLFSYAGTKDRRAVTYQVALNRSPPN